MIKILSIFFACNIIFLKACSSKDNKSTNTVMEDSKKDSTVHEIKNEKGQVVERWGNYHTDDDNMNFRHFFYYDNNGLLINEKQYWFDEGNNDCIIKDTAEYRDIYYTYKWVDNKYVLEIEKCYDRDYNDNGKFIGRRLYYIYDEIKKEYLFGGPNK